MEKLKTLWTKVMMMKMQNKKNIKTIPRTLPSLTFQSKQTTKKHCHELSHLKQLSGHDSFSFEKTGKAVVRPSMRLNHKFLHEYQELNRVFFIASFYVFLLVF